MNSNTVVRNGIRHETLCYELATKFEAQHNVLLDFAENIESLKTYALVTDLHLEAYLPMQIATIAFDVGKGIIQKNKAEKYERHFAKNVVNFMQ